jgi:ABC-type transporter Mla maintaining outer membrane lipid asymmetry permease subunit MlaE
LRLSVNWIALVAAAYGSVLAIQTGFGLREFGGIEYLPRVTSLAAVRDLGASGAISGALIALVYWAHRLDTEQLQDCLRQATTRGFLVAVTGLPIAILFALVSSYVTAAVVYGIDWTTFASASLVTLTIDDYFVAFGQAIVVGLILTPVARLLLPWFARQGWNLPSKIIATWTGLLAFRLLYRALVSAMT